MELKFTFKVLNGTFPEYRMHILEKGGYLYIPYVTDEKRMKCLRKEESQILKEKLASLHLENWQKDYTPVKRVQFIDDAGLKNVNVTYCYRGYKYNGAGQKVYSTYSEEITSHTAITPMFTGTITNAVGTTSRLIHVQINNKGKADMTITDYGICVLSNTTGTNSSGYISSNYGLSVLNMIKDPYVIQKGKTSYIEFKLDESRVLFKGSAILFTVTCDGFRYYIQVSNTGKAIYLDVD